jgi:hypothetical protein
VALVKCKECGGEVSTSASACPKCGAEVTHARKYGVGKLIAIAFLLAVIAAALQDVFNPTPTGDAAAAVAKPAAPGAQWSYRHEADSMSKGLSSTASVSSTNAAQFKFPYSGAQRGILTIRTHPRYGKNVMFQIERGQIQCRSYQDCAVLVRFDDAQAEHFSGRGPDDGSTTLVFILNYARFLDKMAKAKTVRISAPVYQEGSPIFEFNVAAFDRSKYVPSPASSAKKSRQP